MPTVADIEGVPDAVRYDLVRGISILIAGDARKSFSLAPSLMGVGRQVRISISQSRGAQQVRITNSGESCH